MIDRLNAALKGRYRVERELGEGGMATVFLAEDQKHDRQVAIKVLKPELAAVIGGERFVTEIKTTAALQHPHILPLFDSGAADGFLYYVMPYVDGESLRQKLDREKQLSVDESVRIASAVASALHYAHEQGIVHRDIKPANILIHAGEPVVADFGIALAISAAGGGRLTETGMSVGTPHYMSPEQASADRDVSARSDTYALACVLYEMLAGEPPHTGSTAQAVLMRILTEEPRDVSDVRKAVPPHLRDAIARALEKLPADRFESADAFKRALTDENFRYRRKTGARRAATAPDERPTWLRDARTLALLGLVAMLGVGFLWAAAGRSEPEAAEPMPAFRYVVDDTLREGIGIAISRNGDVAYSASDGGRAFLRLRRASSTRAEDIPNTDGIGNTVPSFSPDGHWIAFQAHGAVKKIQINTGTEVTLVPDGELPDLFTIVWTERGTILTGGPQGIHSVPEVGGTPEQLTGGPGVFPRFLPGGQKLIYTSVPGGNPANGRVVALDLETGDTITIADPGGNAYWSPTGHVLYGHPSATVFAVPFDAGRGEVTGAPTPVQENVFTFGAISFYALSGTGALAFIGGGGQAFDPDRIELAWLYQDGTTEALPLTPTDHPDARISPDGRSIAYTREDHIYVFDLDRGTNQRLTFEGSAHHDPVWSPDGLRVAFTSSREEDRDYDIYVKDIDGRSPAEWLGGDEGQQYPADWLADGTVTVYARATQGAQTDILAFQAGTDSVPRSLLRADWNETWPRVSPDGTLMAYVSNETGENHVFVRGFPDMSGRWQVTESPGVGPIVWARDGSALLYQDPGTGSLVRAAVEFDPTFRVTDRSDVTDGPSGQLRDAHPDGQRFLITRPVGAEALQDDLRQELTVVANWFTELRRRLGEEQGGG